MNSPNSNHSEGQIALDLFKSNHKPDILQCLANLSNDEVFTPPEITNKMLDLLPEEIWSNPNIKFLDPACKTGVFLREITKRLIKGLEDKIPNLQERIDHITQKMIYGIAITELTGLLSRRTVYCSKNADSKYSISQFNTNQGNIIFTPQKHTWENGKCKFCGASQTEYDRDDTLEQHAYQFIHTLKPEEIFNMKFDVIIGNPPYQMSDGGAQASAKPIYQLFVQQAKKLNPNYLTMIIPARFFTGGKGLDEFRDNMIHDKHISVLHDFASSDECFQGVDIKGGVCYFLWEKEHNGMCNVFRHNVNGVSNSKRYLVDKGDDIYIRENMLVSIKNKVQEFGEKTLDLIVSPRKPYNLAGDAIKSRVKYKLPPMSDIPIKGGYKLLGLDTKLKRVYKYLEKDYPFERNEGLNKYKIFIAESYGCGEIGDVPSTPILATPRELCTETFIQIGPFDTKLERDNCYSYIKTKFFRALVGIRKQTQHATRTVYQFVPIQDFSKPWTDEELYKKYKLTKEEIDFIESMIRPME